MNRTSRLRRRCLLLVVMLMVSTLSCASKPETEDGSGAGGGEERVRTGAPASGDDSTTPSSVSKPAAMVARTDRELAVHPAPEDEAVVQTLPAKTAFGSTRVLLVTSSDDEWLEVLLPVRPNGSTGWVRRKEVEVERVSLELRIDLTKRTLTLLDAGGTVLTTPVAIGSADAPTPTGRFSVTDKLVTDDERSAYGPFALGLSGHSEVLSEFGGGDGQIGIHGTNDPNSIGQAVSHGCIRVANDVITRLNEVLPLGTPVVIV